MGYETLACHVLLLLWMIESLLLCLKFFMDILFLHYYDEL